MTEQKLLLKLNSMKKNLIIQLSNDRITMVNDITYLNFFNSKFEMLTPSMNTDPSK